MSTGAVRRLLLVNTVASQGGAARMARSLYEGVRSELRYEARLVVGRGETGDDPDIVRIASPAEVVLHAAVTRLTGLQGYGTARATRRLVDLIGSWQPDILHLHNTHGYYLDLDLLPRIHRSGWNGPVVWTLHDAWAFTGRCAYFMDCDRWQRGCGRCPDLRRYPRTFFDSSALMWKKKQRAFAGDLLPVLVCPSRWLAKAAARSYLGQADIRVVPNGIDTTRFRPRDGEAFRRAHGIPADHPIVLFAANSLGVERKGGNLAARVMRRLGQEDLTVVTLGTTDPSLPSGPKFKHLGYLDDVEQVARVFGSANLFTILSLDENFPTTVLEALASGLPVVGFSVGGIPEQVDPGCGVLTAPADIDGVVGQIRRLIADRTRLETMAEQARHRAVREYTLEVFVDRHVALYEALLSRSVGSQTVV